MTEAPREPRSARSTMRRFGGRLVLASAVASILSVDAVAHAQGTPGVSNEMRAEYLFREGSKKFDAGKHAQACADFAESLRLGPKLGTLLNLALCHETIGKPATAWSEYHHGAAWAAQNGQKDRHDFALQHAVALETKLPRVLLTLPSDSAIATVDVDGEPLADARWYLPIFLDPGEHSVTLSAPGKQRSTVKFRVILSPTEQLVNVPPLADEVVVVPPPPAPAVVVDPDRTRRLAGYVTLGAGGVGLALGLTFGLLATSKRDEIGSQCAGNRCTETGADRYRDAQTKAAVSTWSTAIGVGAAAVGGWLVLTSKPKTTVKPAVGFAPRSGGGELSLGASF